VLSYRPTPDAQWRICIPTQQLEDVINWFHFALNHCRLHRLLATISMHLYHPKMRSVAEHVAKNCDTCQKQKVPGPQYGHLSPRNVSLLPWEEVASDLIGPWTVTADQESYDFYALTCIGH
jgi:hypothetical protein